MKIKPHEFTGKRIASEIVLEWAHDDALVLEVRVRDVRPRRDEGAVLSIDHACGSVSFAGAVSVTASAVMTEAEARQLHAKLGELLA